MVLQQYPVCNPFKSAIELMKCLIDYTGSKKLEVRCEIQDTSCRFRLACSMDPIFGMHCQKGQHIYTGEFCCDFVCISKSRVHFTLRNILYKVSKRAQ